MSIFIVLFLFYCFFVCVLIGLVIGLIGFEVNFRYAKGRRGEVGGKGEREGEESGKQ